MEQNITKSILIRFVFQQGGITDLKGGFKTLKKP